MTAKYDNAFVRNAMEAFDKGESLKGFCQRHKVSATHLTKAIRRHEPGYIFPSQKAAAECRAQGAAVVEMYEGGMSVLAIANLYGCSRQVVSDVLDGHGVILRDGSKANLVRMNALSREERIALSRNARAKRMENLGDHARARVEAAAIGRGEDELFDLLTTAGFEPQRQVLFDRYAIDIVFRNVAVEVKFSRSANRFGITRQNEGDVEISKSDRVLCILGTNHALAIGAAAGEIIALLDFVSRQPPAPGQYWMIWCRFEDQVPHDAKPNDLAVMAIPPKVSTTIGKRYLC